MIENLKSGFHSFNFALIFNLYIEASSSPFGVFGWNMKASRRLVLCIWLVQANSYFSTQFLCNVYIRSLVVFVYVHRRTRWRTNQEERSRWKCINKNCPIYIKAWDNTSSSWRENGFFFFLNQYFYFLLHECNVWGTSNSN